MLKRIYIDNYRCLVNFDFVPKSMQLVLGLNGTGKSSVFDALSCLRKFVTEGRTTTELFRPESLTRWQKLSEQTFEVELKGNGGLYRYRLVIEYKLETRENRVQIEELTFDGKPLYLFKDGEAQLYRDTYSEGPHFPIDWSRSGIFGISPRPGVNTKMTWFKQRIGKLLVLRVNPVSIGSRTEEEDQYPEGDMSNFASWYRNLSQESPGSIHNLFDSLKEIIDGFSSLNLVKDGEQVRILKVQVTAKPNTKREKPLNFSFNELSDGERVLIVLYTLLHCAVDPDTTLCIDEPGNYLALPEIQPWLMALRDKIAEKDSQAIILSHNSEIINYLASENAVNFERMGAGPVRVQEFDADLKSGLSASELIARGWDNGKA